MSRADSPTLHLDADDPDRSRFQSRIWDPEVESWLDQIDVQPGWQCVDLGCGAMGILETLARRSGPSGRVTGVEPRAPLLEAAREFAVRGKLDNVRLLDSAPERMSLPDDFFHLVHERFLLSAGADRRALLSEMVRITRPGGIVALEEPDSAAWRCYPPSGAWERLREAVRSAVGRSGGDLDAGTATFARLREARLDDVRIRAATIALQGAHPAKRLLVELAEARRDRVLETGMAERDLVHTMLECDRIARDPSTVVISFGMTQVWGRKPRRGWRRSA